ncbi:MAG: hypothetical protein INR72_20115, partial [Williamsia herbipolensis]|nr:hypothetical protein [Williamsia herbipolensis]
GAFYADGRMYYTLSGRSSLYYRYFSPDSGIVGATEFTATGGNFGSVAGMFLSGSTLYYADSSGNLHSVAFSDGGTNGQNPSVDTTTDTVVSGPSVDGNTWGARSLFAAPLPPSSDIAYVDSASGYVNKNTAVSVTTPADVASGDTQLLYVATSNATAGQIATPAGWTKVAEQDSLPLQTAVFEQTATASSAGSTVTVTVGAAARVQAQLVAYSGVSAATPTTAGASDSLQASHTAPAVSVGTAGSWVVSYWADRSSTTTGWTLPGDVTQRNEVLGTGGGQLTGVVADSNIAVAAGSYPTQTASVGADNSGKAAMISLVLPPA